MKKMTPVEAYRLLSGLSNKPIVFVSSRGTPCSRLLGKYLAGLSCKIGNYLANLFRQIAVPFSPLFYDSDVILCFHFQPSLFFPK